MKNTIRATHKNGNKPASAQLKKGSIQGQNTATIGHDRFGTRGKVTIGALRVGEAMGMNEGEINALSYVCAQSGMSPDDYCKSVVITAMQAKYEKPGRDALWDALSKFEFVQWETIAFLELLAAHVEKNGEAGDPVIAGIGVMTGQVRQKITDVFNSVFNAYKAAFPTAS